MRTGDTVKHRPSGETWTVAYIDGDELSWCGWPFGWASIADCDLVTSCTDDEHIKLLRDIAGYRPDGTDHRPARARAQLEAIDPDYAKEKFERLIKEADELERAYKAKRAEQWEARDAWIKVCSAKAA